MNAAKAIFILILSMISLSSAFAQGKDEAFGPTDPIKSVQVYPNPATEFLNIRFETPIAKKSVFKIHNIIGNEILVETEAIDDYEVRLKVKDLHEGYYIIALQNIQSGVKSTLKFLKL